MGFYVVLFLVFISSACTVKGQGFPWEEDLRLPTSTYPEHYNLYQHPDLDSKTFTGQVTININSSEPRDYFLVHINYLTVTDSQLVQVEDDARTPIVITEAFNYAPNEFWVVRTEPVNPGNFELTLTYNGSLDVDILGFYYSEYTTPEGETKSLATTKFQPTYARRAYPCFDEPNFKSTFNISIVRPSSGGYKGISNMPVLFETEDSPEVGLTTVTFEKSVKMVSYLSCFIVADFAFFEGTSSNEGNTKVSAYAGTDRIDLIEYSFNMTLAIIPFYENLFNVSYMLPKSDLAAIPDYPSGATEHWGITTYRESLALYDETTDSAGLHQTIASIIGHELVHQWFGNLITCEWWNHLWLNEGFASYYEYHGMDFYEPTFDSMVQFVFTPQHVFKMDSRPNSHAIIVDTEDLSTPGEIQAYFDTIVYYKAPAVIRMMEHFMGENNFLQGLTNFLTKNQYTSVVTQDLYDSLNEIWSGIAGPGEKTDIAEIMDTWTLQMGYPVINVTRNGNTLTFSQDRFLGDPRYVNDPSTSPFGYKWDCPIYLTQFGESYSTWLYRENDTVQIVVNETEFPYTKVNTNMYGYFRVNYEPEMWAELENACLSVRLSNEDCSNLYDDALALAQAGLLDYGVALNLTRGLLTGGYVEWYAAIDRLEPIEELMRSTNSSYLEFNAYVQGIISNMYNNIGFIDEGDHIDKLLRYIIPDFACLNRLEECLMESKSLLELWIFDVNYVLPLHTKESIYYWGMVKGTNDSWNTMWDRMLVETNTAEKDLMYYSLSNSDDLDILNRYITLAQDEDNVSSNDFLTVLAYISENTAGTELVWDWYRANWDWLVSRYSLNNPSFGYLIVQITSTFATQEKLDEMNQFFDDNPAGSGEVYRTQAIANVEENMFWFYSYSDDIIEWLSTYTCENCPQK